MRSVKTLFLESESDKDSGFAYLKDDVIGKVNDVDYSAADDYVKIDFSTTYNKDFSIVTKFTDFKKWFKPYMQKHKESPNVFYDYLKDYLKASTPQEESLTEIIDDTLDIMDDTDAPSNATNKFVGLNQTMDLEKIFKRSMPKSIRNYSGNLGLGTVVW